MSNKIAAGTSKRSSIRNVKIPIDWKEVDKMLLSGCFGTQIAAVLGISDNTLYDRCLLEFGMFWSTYAAKKRAKGDSFLHSKQYQIAMKGNVSMLIWLGKQRLHQSDKPREKQEFNGTLSSLLDVMHMINSAEDFDALVELAKSRKDRLAEEAKEEVTEEVTEEAKEEGQDGVDEV